MASLLRPASYSWLTTQCILDANQLYYAGIMPVGSFYLVFALTHCTLCEANFWSQAALPGCTLIAHVQEIVPLRVRQMYLL